MATKQLMQYRKTKATGLPKQPKWPFKRSATRQLPIKEPLFLVQRDYIDRRRKRVFNMTQNGRDMGQQAHKGESEHT